MAFLDRFRPPPKWKHTDPEIRLVGVQELDASEQETLGALAHNDPDPRVRRSAMRRLEDGQAIAFVAREDQDARTREEAAAQLVTLATSTEDRQTAETLLSLLTEERQIAAVAKGTPLEAVARLALARLTEERLIGGIARHAVSPAVALEAVARVSSPEELLTIALKCDHKDAAVDAVDRFAQARPRHRPSLDAIVSRGKQKAAARRARALLKEIAEPVTPSTHRPQDNGHQRATVLCGQVESLARSSDIARMAGEIEMLVREWETIPADVEPTVQDRFRTAQSSISAALERGEAERMAHDRRAAARAEAEAARMAICRDLETVPATEPPADRIADARAAWTSLPPAPAELGDLEHRFERACRDLERRHEQWNAGEEEVRRLEQICVEAEEVIQLVELEDAIQRWQGVRRDWLACQRAPAASMLEVRREALTAFSVRFEAAAGRMSAREQAGREAHDRALRGNLSKLEQLAARADGLVQAAELSLKQAERAMRDLRSALESPPPLPSRRDHEMISLRLSAARTQLYPRLQELRDADSWQRWANAAVQEELCAKAEALVQMENLTEASRQLHELRTRWKGASLVPRERAEPLWRRFKAAHDQVRARCDAFFAQQAVERMENLQKKEALAAQAEALANSSDWIRTADEIKRLQAEWQAVGPVPRERASELWKRFRTACNRFFKRRQEDLAQRKTEWAANLARKEALCVRVEELAAGSDWEAAVAEVRRLQTEWRTIGTVRRNKSEAIWQRFRQACELFFERYRRKDQLELESHLADRESICQELEALLPGPDAASDPPEDLAGRVRDIRARWQRAPDVPRSHHEVLTARVTAAVERLVSTYPASFAGTDLDTEANRRRMEQLCLKVESLSGPGTAGIHPDETPAEVLARQLREALASNTIGGRADGEARWREAAEEVRKAQAAWKTIGPVLPAAARQLSDRFQRACGRFFSQRPRSLSSASKS